jgi:hypothetical protein
MREANRPPIRRSIMKPTLFRVSVVAVLAAAAGWAQNVASVKSERSFQLRRERKERPGGLRDGRTLVCLGRIDHQDRRQSWSARNQQHSRVSDRPRRGPAGVPPLWQHLLPGGGVGPRRIMDACCPKVVVSASFRLKARLRIKLWRCLCRSRWTVGTQVQPGVLVVRNSASTHI